MNNHSSPINEPCHNGNSPGVIDRAPDPNVTIHETEDLTIDVIKAAVRRRLGSIEQSELRHRLDILVEHSSSRTPDAKLVQFTEFAETRIWIRRASAAIGRLPFLHRRAKAAHEWIAGGIASIRRAAAVKHKKLGG